jgi:hypothetical protein
LDAWTSPNQKVLVTITVHLHQEGEALRAVLDIIEVAKSHSGKNLAEALLKVLNDFEIPEKVSVIDYIECSLTFHLATWNYRR